MQSMHSTEFAKAPVARAVICACAWQDWQQRVADYRLCGHLISTRLSPSVLG